MTLQTSLKKLKNIMFADDTNLFITGQNMTRLENTLNEELDKVNEWFRANLLSLNISKTSYIIFGNKKNVDVHIRFGSTEINRVDQTKFLGVIISSNLKWNKHIEVVHSKASKEHRYSLQSPTSLASKACTNLIPYTCGTILELLLLGLGRYGKNCYTRENT